jgi:hemerythrin-like domain-containing protein
VTRKVLDAATLPVLVAAVESNLAARSDEQRALALLRDEHRSLAAVLHALLAQFDDPVRRPEHALLRAMLFYIEQFPERLHHPKEEQHLFARLRARSDECDALIAELQAQHAAGAAQFERLRSLLDAGDDAAFARAAQAFAQDQWQHMRLEESLVLPAASRHVQADDWRAIAAAFEADVPPRLDASESFDALANRLLELAGRN